MSMAGHSLLHGVLGLTSCAARSLMCRSREVLRGRHLRTSLRALCICLRMGIDLMASVGE